MKLGDLRKLAIRQQSRIRFVLANGMECVVNERGIAQVAALRTVPDFNLEHELAAAQQFVLDTLTTDPKQPIQSRELRREELAALAGGGPTTADVHDHDDE
jgi:hypothetical protein